MASASRQRDVSAKRGRRAARAIVILAALAVGLLAPVSLRAQAQPGEGALRRALDLENAAKYREAALVYREAITQGAVVQGMLGLERTFGALGQEDSVLPPVDALLRTSARDPVLRGVMLRTLRALGRDAAAQRAFEAWRALDPRDAAPYREYVRILLMDRRTGAADSVLRQAVEAHGGARDFATEFADLYATMGRWDAAAAAWRDAIADDQFMDQTASYSLMGAPSASRDGVRQALTATPAMPLVTRNALIRTRALLELRWGSPRDAWRALSALPPNDTTAQTWIDFADEAEHANGALAARDALESAYRVRRDPALALRAANDAMAGGDAAGALRLATDVSRGLDSTRAATEALPLRVRALAEQGKAKDAEALIAAYGARVTDPQRRLFARSLAWGWIRAGDIARARKAAAEGGGEDEDVVSGWLALFDGNLDAARSGLRTAEEKSPEILTALAFISRAKVTHAPGIGAAFLALARGDSAQASRAFEQAAVSVPEAASFLIGLAARVAATRGDETRALGLWQQLVEQYPTTPEAAEADLEWARALQRRGDRAGATARYEHLILTWPDSALVPQAREALDRMRLAPDADALVGR
jgi:tetratricopeptide (TPR) repeat protein